MEIIGSTSGPVESMNHRSQGTDPENREFSINEVIKYIVDIKKLRILGNMMKISPGKLNEIFLGQKEQIHIGLARAWFNEAQPTRWEDLTAILSEPALKETRIVGTIERELSKDSAVDVSSPLSSCSSFCDREYQISFIGKRSDKCSISSVLNCIADYSEWSDIGRHLNISRAALEMIEREYPPEDRPAYMVEEWWKSTTDTFTWVTLKRALMNLRPDKFKQISLRSNSSQDLSYSLEKWKMRSGEQIDPPTDEHVLEKMTALNDQFKELKRNIYRTIREKKIDIYDLMDTIDSLWGEVPAVPKTSASVGDARGLFKGISEYWTFLDYDILQEIVKVHASNDLRKTVDEYVQNLKTFRKKIVVSQLMKVWKYDSGLRGPKYPEGKNIREMITMLDINPNEYTLEDVDVLRRGICDFLHDVNLSQTVLLLYELKKCCLLVTWILPVVLAKMLSESFKVCIREGTFFKENYIISIQLNGEIFKTMERMLLDASREGKDREVDRIMGKWNRNKHNYDDTDQDGKTALILASEVGHNGVIVSLLEAKVSIDYQPGDTERSALFFASEGRHHRAVQLLLEYGADVGLKDKDGIAAIDLPLTKEVQSCLNKTRFIEKLVKKLLPKKRKDLLHLCQNGEFGAVRELLHEKGDVDVNTQDSKGFSPLMYTCQKGCFEIAELLIQHNADVNLRANNGSTALHLACCVHNFVRIAYLLLRAGARVNEVITEKKNYTLVAWLSDLEDRVESARALLKHRADLSIQIRKNGWTPLIQATFHRRKELVELYLEYGADVNFQAKKGWTALMEAARKGSEEIAELLIKKGAQLDMVMEGAHKQTGESAIYVASYMGNHKVANLLAEKGAEVNKTNEVGLTPLMLAISRGKLKVVEGIIEQSKTIDLDVPQKDTGLTALFLAARKGHQDIFKFLLEHGAKDEIESFSVLDVIPSSNIFKRRAFASVLKNFKMADTSLVELQPERVQVPDSTEMIHTPPATASVPGDPIAMPPTKELADIKPTTLKEEGSALREGSILSRGYGMDLEDTSLSEQIQEISIESLEEEEEEEEEKEEKEVGTAHITKETTDASSLYDAEELVPTPSQPSKVSPEVVLDRSKDMSPQPVTGGTKLTKTSKGLEKKVPKQALEHKSMDLNQRLQLLDKILKDYDRMIRHSDYDSTDLNEDSISGKGVKNEPSRHVESQELIMTNIRIS